MVLLGRVAQDLCIASYGKEEFRVGSHGGGWS